MSSRPSILRASGHTFEYLGFSKVTTQLVYHRFRIEHYRERRVLITITREEWWCCCLHGYEQWGDYIGNKRVTSTTGEETTFDAPTPTVTGQDPSD